MTAAKKGLHINKNREQGDPGFSFQSATFNRHLHILREYHKGTEEQASLVVDVVDRPGFGSLDNHQTTDVGRLLGRRDGGRRHLIVCLSLGINHGGGSNFKGKRRQQDTIGITEHTHTKDVVLAIGERLEVLGATLGIYEKVPFLVRGVQKTAALAIDHL